MPPCLIFAGACLGGETVLVRDQACGEHVSRPREARLKCAGSFFRFRHHRLHYFVLSSLDFGEFKRFRCSIYRNLKELSFV